jgi:hypothetical protein
MKPAHALLHLLFLALTALPPATPAPTPGVVADKADAKTARGNRETIENALLGGNVCQLPAGVIHLDRALLLGPQHSGGTLQGTGPTTVLRNSFSAGVGENGTLQAGGTGIAYYQSAAIVGNAYVLDPTVPGTPLPWDHPSNQSELLTPGAVVYQFAFDSYLSQTPPPRKRSVVVSFDRATRRLVTAPPPTPGLTSLKWMAGRPVADVKEGDRTVRLLVPLDTAAYPAGRSVYVTSGPSIANAAVGEHRRVLGVDPATGRVTLDRAVTRGYTDAALALVEPVANLTVRRLTLAQPAEPRANPLFLQFCVGLRLDHVYSKEEKATTCCLANCGDAELKDCEVNGLMLNLGHDTTVDGGVYTQIYGEEASTTTKLSNLTIKANTVQPANGVTWHVGCDRLTLSRVRIEGFGTVVPGSGGSNAFNLGGRGLQMWDVSVNQINGVGSGYLGGDDGTVLRLTSNTPLTIQAGKGWRVVDSSSPGWDLRAGTTGVASGTPFMPKAPGWSVGQ